MKKNQKSSVKKWIYLLRWLFPNTKPALHDNRQPTLQCTDDSANKVATTEDLRLLLYFANISFSDGVIIFSLLNLLIMRISFKVLDVSREILE